LLSHHFLPFADSFAIRLAPYFFRPILAASAPGLLTPRRASVLFSLAKRLPDPSFALAISSYLRAKAHADTETKNATMAAMMMSSDDELDDKPTAIQIGAVLIS
jgi:hypothetical protein